MGVETWEEQTPLPPLLSVTTIGFIQKFLCISKSFLQTETAAVSDRRPSPSVSLYCKKIIVWVMITASGAVWNGKNQVNTEFGFGKNY